MNRRDRENLEFVADMERGRAWGAGIGLVLIIAFIVYMWLS
jgi:hypothetical protein